MEEKIAYLEKIRWMRKNVSLLRNKKDHSLFGAPVYPPFSDQHGSIIIPDEQFQAWAALETQESRINAFKGLVLLASSPYELWGMIFNRSTHSLGKVIPNFQHLVLGLVSENAFRWDIDEVICFLLEVATDHPDLGEVAMENLLQLKCDLIELGEYSAEMLFQMLAQDTYAEVINILYEEAKWQKPIQQLIMRIADAQFPDGYKGIYSSAAIKLLEAKTSVNVGQSATVVVEGCKLFDQQQYFEAIERFLKFYATCPNVFPDQISLQIAQSFFELDWKGEALRWTTTALNHNPNFQPAHELQQQISAPYQNYLERIKHEIVQPHWTTECADIFATTELLFRMHGSVMGDYGSIINGYGRSVEVQLNQRLFPKIQSWIREYGNCEISTGRSFVRNGRRKIYSDEQQNSLTLGAWAALLYDDRAYPHVDESGSFFYGAARFPNGLWGYYEWSQKLSALGKSLKEISILRNKASHGSSLKWEAVERARSLCLSILGGIPIKNGNLLD